MDGKILHIFIDESGNFDFSNTGTEHFVMAAASTFTPVQSVTDLTHLKYTLNRQGHLLEYFHATEDLQFVRDQVFPIISGAKDIEIDSVFVKKRKAHPSLYQQEEPIFDQNRAMTGVKIMKTEEIFYFKLVQCLLQYIFKRHNDFRNTDEIIVYLGSLMTNKKRDAILKLLKPYLKQNFQKPFRIYFHETKCDVNMQVADYCSWAVFVELERGEGRPRASIENKIRSRFDLFGTGQQFFY